MEDNELCFLHYMMMDPKQSAVEDVDASLY